MTYSTCATCGQSIMQTQPYSDGWVHERNRKERCDPMYPQSPTATPIGNADAVVVVDGVRYLAEHKTSREAVVS